MQAAEGRRERTIQAYARWLEEFRWDLYATLKITSGAPSDSRAKKLLQQFMSELEEKEGGSRFRYFAVLERGFTGDNLHFHVLIGGLRNRCKFWEREWNERGGNALITPYDPTQKGILYMLKNIDDNGDLDVEFKLPESAKRKDKSPER
jgi:hypothetical protein